MQYDQINDIKVNKKYGSGKEAQNVRDEIGDFDPSKCEAMIYLRSKYDKSLRICELKGIINAVRLLLNSKNIFLPKLSRNANRSFVLCVKYINDNLDLMMPFLPYITLLDEQGNDICEKK